MRENRGKWNKVNRCWRNWKGNEIWENKRDERKEIGEKTRDI